MSEEMLVCHCSPTLAGLKTGSLFSCPYRSKKKIIREIRSLNQRLVKKGVCVLPVVGRCMGMNRRQKFCSKNIKNAQKYIAGNRKVAWLLNSSRLLYNQN